jgi:cobalt-zinc-cadmium efflux system protein
MNVSGVQQVHDLHVWALSTHEAALSAHVLTVSSNVDEIAFTLREMLKKSFEIQHSTIQIEQQGGVANCNPAQDPGCC